MNSAKVVHLRRREIAPTVLFNAAMVVAGSLAVALSAQLAIRLPGSPVPITAQSLAVLLIGALLGWKRGAAALGLYLAEGACGLPVFAGGAAGMVYLAGPTGGYLMGFVPAAALTGWIVQQDGAQRLSNAVFAMIAGTAAVFICGVLWLSAMTGLKGALLAGLVPFVPGALIKIALGAALLPAGWRLLAALQAMRPTWLPGA